MGRARVLARRLAFWTSRCIFALDQGRGWASATIPRPRDEDAIPTKGMPPFILSIPLRLVLPLMPGSQ
jgi:hypothetical protein